MNGTERDLFRTWFPSDPALEHACQVAVERSLAVKPGERVLIVTNPETEVSAISLCLYDACAAAGVKPSILFQPVKGQLDFADPGVIAAIAAAPDVVVSMSAERMGKDRAAQQSPIAHEGASGTTCSTTSFMERKPFVASGPRGQRGRCSGERSPSTMNG
jgi:hypothetical protein